MKNDKIEIYENGNTYIKVINGDEVALWTFYIKKGNIILMYEANFYRDIFNYLVISKDKYYREIYDSFDLTTNLHNGDPMLNKLVSMFEKEIRKLKLKQILD